MSTEPTDIDAWFDLAKDAFDHATGKHDEPDEPEARDPAEPPIDWNELDGEPPAREWWIQDWLGPTPTLVAGPGGAGKTRLWQTVAASLACGKAYLGAQTTPKRVLMWQCEETRDDVWRLQSSINAHFDLHMRSTSLGNLCIVPRQGLENTLLDMAFGRPVFTPLLERLREQVNDLKVDILVLDNLAQVFGGNESDRHQATYFVNGVAGLVRDRPFAPVFLGHTARAQGSEYSGSAAWENACRMRWYVGPTLPDQKREEDEPPESDIVYLARRKANYAAKDWRKLKYTAGLLLPAEALMNGHDPGAMFRDQAVDDVVLGSIPKLIAAGVHPTDGRTSGDYLPAQILAKGYAGGHTKKELAQAMNRLMGAGRLKRGVVGMYANRTPRSGLIVV